MLTEENEEKVVVVQEVERTHRHKIEIEASIREAVANDHEIRACLFWVKTRIDSERPYVSFHQLRT